MAQLDLAPDTGMRKGKMYGIQGTKKKRPSDRDAHGSALDWTLVNMQACEINLLWAKRGPGYFVLLNKVAMAALRILQERSTTGAVIRNERKVPPLITPKHGLSDAAGELGLREYLGIRCGPRFRQGLLRLVYRLKTLTWAVASCS